MKTEDIKLEMKVAARNCFGATYFVKKINKTTCWIEYRTGEKIMRGGKWIDEVFLYKNVRCSMLQAA